MYAWSTQLQFGLKPACSSLIFSSVTASFLLQRSDSHMMFFPTVLSSVISLQYSGLALSPVLNRMTDLLLLLSITWVCTCFPAPVQYNTTIEVISHSPLYLRNSFTISCAPAALLFLSLATHSSSSSLVNFLCNPLEPLSYRLHLCLCPPVDFSPTSVSNFLLVFGVPRLR